MIYGTEIASFYFDAMSRLESIRNRNTRARKLDTPAVAVTVPLAASRPTGWKLLWLGAVAARRVGRFRQTLA